MGSMRFRRSVRVAPGLRLKVNKRSVGLSAGTRGARVSVNSDGRSTRSVGIPGSGLYYRSQTGPRPTTQGASPAATLPPEARPSRVIRKLVVGLSVTLFVLLLIAGQGNAAGAVFAVGLLAWLGLWIFGGLVDLAVFAWLRRSQKAATAVASGPVVGRVERAVPAFPAALPSSEDDEVELSPANVEANWRDGETWLTWEAPRNFVAGESHYMTALRKLTGQPRQNGYLIPAEVVFIREPTNRYDSNAWRAEVDGLHVGYAARHIAAQLTQGFEPYGLTSFTVCGVIRGGSLDAPNIGVHIWPDRRPCPGPEIRQIDDALGVSWPPAPREGAYCSTDEEQRFEQGRLSAPAETRPAADMFDVYLQRGRETIDSSGPEDRALEALKAAADIASANENADQKEAAAALAERLVGYARGTKTLAQAARIKKRLEPKVRSAKGTKTVEERLADLQELHERGVITKEEYTAQRAAIIKQV